MTNSLRSRPLGRTGIELTELALGTWGLCGESYGPVPPELRARTLACAIENGVRTFDMSPLWGDDAASEREVSEAVGARRDEMIYVTRVGYRATPSGPEPSFEHERLIEDCEASLRRLKTDRIDILLLHNPHESELHKEGLQSAVEALKTAGKIRVWGASISQIDDAHAALAIGAQVLCLPASLLRQQLLQDIGPLCSARGAGILARSVLASGALSGAWNAYKRFSPDDHRSQRWLPDTLAERVRQVSTFQYLVREPVVSMASASLRFVLAHDIVSCAIIGPRNPGQVEAAVEALKPGPPYLADKDFERARRQR